MSRFVTILGFTALMTAVPTYAVTVTPAPPALINKAFILMDYDSGRILAESNSHTHLAPASLTKMMTSFIVEQKLLKGMLKEQDPVLMSESAWCRGSTRAT